MHAGEAWAMDPLERPLAFWETFRYWSATAVLATVAMWLWIA